MEEIQRIKAENPNIPHLEAFSTAAINTSSCHGYWPGYISSFYCNKSFARFDVKVDFNKGMTSIVALSSGMFFYYYYYL
ncbi:hypothetical protein REPUB_Repub05bG0078100 [Reevesia pubescens]